MSNPQVTATISANDLASPKIRELMATLKQAEKIANEAFNGNGIGGKYASSINQATGAAQRHLGVLGQIHAAHKAIAATVAGYAAVKSWHGSVDAVRDYLPYGREDRAIQARTGYSASDMAMLRRQQAELASTRAAPVESTQKAQEIFGRLKYDAATNVAIMGPTASGAKAMGVQPEQGAELMESLISQFGVQFDSPADARRKVAHLNDLAAVATKKSNATFADLAEGIKFSGAAAHAGGISLEQDLAAIMALRRAGISGSEGGVFMRQFVARGMSPTRKGRDALAQAGINIDEYATHGTISGEGLSEKYARNFGKKLSTAAVQAFDKTIEEHPEVLGDRGKFAEAAVKSFGKDLSATDRKNVAKSANEYYDFTRSGFKLGGLLERIIQLDNPAAAQAFVGDKQGARMVALQQEQGKYFAAKADLSHSERYSDKVASDMMQGLAPSVDRLTSSFDALEKGLVAANEVWITPLVNGATSLITSFNGLSDGTKQVVGVMTGLAALTAGGGAVAATGALAVSAWRASAALNVIATRGIGGAAEAGVAGVAGRKALGALGTVGWMAAGVTAMVAAEEAIKNLPDGSNGRRVNAGGTRGAAVRKGFWDSIPLPSEQAHWWRYDPRILQHRTSASLNALDFDSAPSGSWEHDAVSTTLGSRKGGKSWGWQDSIIIGSPRHSEGFGDAAKSAGPSQVNVNGTVTGNAELHVGIQGQLTPTPYFQALIQRAEAVANMGINGRLGTSMQGPGDNSTKPAQSALTGTH